jgi:O-antigen/teichoic acid export membrane protein
MSGQLRKLGKHTLVYTAGIMLGKVASFIMLPVYTRYLTTADYGVLELLGMTIDVIGMIAGVGLVTAVFKFYSAEDDPGGKRAVMSTASIGVVALAVVTSLLGLALSPLLSRLIFGSAANTRYLQLYFVIYLLQNIEYVPLLLIRAENRAVLFVTANTLKLAAMLFLNILFVVYFRMGIGGVLMSNVIASTGSASLLLLYLVRRVGITFDTDKFRRMLEFGKPLILWWLGSFVLVFSDRYFLNYYANTSAVGVYSLAYKFAFLLNTLAYAPFEIVWTSERFEIAKRPDAGALYGRIFLYVNVVLGGVALAICLFIKDVLTLMSAPPFRPAYHLVPLLIAAQILFTWAGYWNVGIYLTGKTRAMANAAIGLVPLTLLLNFLLIPRFGMYGAAWATLIAYATRFAWIYNRAQAFYPVPYRWDGMIKLYGILVGATALHFLYQPEGLYLSILWSASLLIFTTAIVYGTVLQPEDRGALKSLMRGLSPWVFLSRAQDAA